MLTLKTASASEPELEFFIEPFPYQTLLFGTVVLGRCVLCFLGKSPDTTSNYSQSQMTALLPSSGHNG